jgi:protein-serine/threonine kinase
MPSTATLHAEREGAASPRLSHHNGGVNGTPTSPVPSSPSWKSILRIGNGSNRKLSGTVNASQLTLDMNGLASPGTLTPGSGHASPTPTSFVQGNRRSSLASSNTHSSDSNPTTSSRPPHQTPGVQGWSSSHPTLPPIEEPQPSKDPEGIKSEKQRELGRGRSKAPKSAFPQTSFQSQQSFGPSQHSPSRPPLSPRAVSASASRFIRRVASAPNAKGLFSMSRSSSSHGASTTKNGLLAPAEAVPPLPSSSNGASQAEGCTSIDTTSSSSSRGKPPRPTSSRKGSAAKLPKTKDRVTKDALEGPGKMAFRRTYSSNSIKIRSVSTTQCIIYEQLLIHHMF